MGFSDSPNSHAVAECEKKYDDTLGFSHPHISVMEYDKMSWMDDRGTAASTSGIVDEGLRFPKPLVSQRFNFATERLKEVRTFGLKILAGLVDSMGEEPFDSHDTVAQYARHLSGLASSIDATFVWNGTRPGGMTYVNVPVSIHCEKPGQKKLVLRLKGTPTYIAQVPPQTKFAVFLSEDAVKLETRIPEKKVKQNGPLPPDYDINSKHAAKILGVTQGQVLKLFRAGKILTLKIGESYYTSQKALHTFKANRPSPGRPPYLR